MSFVKNESMYTCRKSNLPLTYVHRIYKDVNERSLHDVLDDTQLLPVFQYLQHFFGLPSIDLVPVLAFLADKSLEDEKVTLAQMVQFFGKDVTCYGDLEDCVNALAQMKMVSIYYRSAGHFEDLDQRSKIFKVRPSVMNALIKADNHLFKPEPIKTLIQFLAEVSRLTRLRSKGNIDTTLLITELEFLYGSCTEIDAVAAIRNLHMGEEMELIFWNICHCCINRNEEDVDFADIVNEIYENPTDAFAVKKSLMDGELILLKQDLIKINKEYFSFMSQVRMTDFATTLLFGKLDYRKVSFRPKHCKLEDCQQLPNETLFYNDSEREQIQELMDIIRPEPFLHFLQKTKEYQLTGALTILLHGYAGTGKTATAKKLAKESGRHLLWVEVNKIKSCFVGESEQNLQAVFDEYEQACRVFDKHPVLLFNEADAILAKRMNVNSSADQMNNSLQNILLQRMENFSGIFIATTNLASHLDKAFDRRFLYKIQFTKPDEEIRMKIMQNAFPEQAISTLEKINRYALTGGQIMNIKKRLMVQHLLNREAAPLEQLCEEELSLQSKATSIGFAIPKNN